MTAKQYKNRRFVMFGDMGNIKQYVLDKKENKRFDSKWALMDKLNELSEENDQLRGIIEEGLGVSQVEIDEELERGRKND